MRHWGLKTCETCRKALRALDDAGIAIEFADIRKELDPATLARWIGAVGIETLLNRSSATWRGLSEPEKAGDPAALLLAHPALVKRPVIEAGEAILVGKDAAQRAIAAAGR